MKTVIRWLVGLAFVARGLDMLGGSMGSGSQGAVAGSALFAFAAIILGAVILSPELASWMATPFTRFIDGIYLPGGTSAEKPEPNYPLADHYYRSGKNDLAIEEYEKVIHNHPGETRAYIALIDLWGNRMGEPAKAERIYRRGLRKIRQSDARQELRDAYRSDDLPALILPQAAAPDEPLGGRVKFPDLR